MEKPNVALEKKGAVRPLVRLAQSVETVAGVGPKRRSVLPVHAGNTKRVADVHGDTVEAGDVQFPERQVLPVAEGPRMPSSEWS